MEITKFKIDFSKHPKECLHKQCPECKGTGLKRNSKSCHHEVFCACIQCRNMAFMEAAKI